MKRGFTIIELLVVISIIGLISSVALANLQTAKGNARVAAGKQFQQTLQSSLGDESIGRWDFNEGAGGTAYDSSGSGIDGTVVGATYVESDIDGGFALAFDGNDYIAGTDFPTADTDNLTISAWIKPNNIASQNTLFQVGDTSCAKYQTSIVGGKGSVATTNVTVDSANVSSANNLMEDGDTPASSGSETTEERIVSNNQWQNVAFIYNTNSVDVYVNGSKVDSVARATSNCNSQDWSIGSAMTSNSFGNGFSGIMDNVQAFSTALTPTEVSQLYKDGLKARMLAVSGK